MFSHCKTKEDARHVFQMLSKEADGHLETLIEIKNKFEEFLSSLPEKKVKIKFKEVDLPVKVKSPEMDILGFIALYAEENPDFQGEFFYSICNQIQQKTFISAKQYNTLVKIFYFNKMDEYFSIVGKTLKGIHVHKKCYEKVNENA